MDANEVVISESVGMKQLYRELPQLTTCVTRAFEFAPVARCPAGKVQDHLSRRKLNGNGKAEACLTSCSRLEILFFTVTLLRTGFLLRGAIKFCRNTGAEV